MAKERYKTDINSEGWVSKLRYSRSFMAKLILSEPQTKEFYAALATRLLSYEKMRSRLSWSGIRFTAGRKPVAKISFGGKTINIALALSPEDYPSGKYKLKELKKTGRNRAFGGKLRISSAGANRFALKLIDDIAERNSLSVKKTPIAEISAKDFPADTFQNLLARGLIRLLKSEVKPPETMPFEAAIGDSSAEIPKTDRADAYYDTLVTSEELMCRHEEFGEILNAVRGGAIIKFRKKDVLSSLDEKWISALEDSMQALDEVIRAPSHFIEENEELLPIERTKKVTPRSLLHLSQHTGLISRIEGDNVIPSKLLNVFRDDSIMTYENKFINTLILRLYEFVAVRFETAAGAADRETTELEAAGKLDFEEVNASFSTKISIVAPKKEGGKNYAKNSDLYERARKLYEAVGDYRESDFRKRMGGACIRPPVMHTNAILKNKNLRQCLMLWEFIEGYEDKAGFASEERECAISKEYEEQVFRAVAGEYLVFRHNALSAKKKQEKAVIKAASTYASEVAASKENPEAQKDEMLFAIEAAVAADVALSESSRKERERKRAERLALEMKQAEREGLEKERQHSSVDNLPVSLTRAKVGAANGRSALKRTKTAPFGAGARALGAGEGSVYYRKSLAAKLMLGDSAVKEYYVGIYNKFTARAGVRARASFGHVTFYFKGKPLALITVIGKTLRVYYALDFEDLEPKYHAADCSKIRKYAATPAMLKVRSNRAYGYALELAEKTLAGIPEIKPHFVLQASDYPKRDIEQLIPEGLVRKDLRASRFGKGFALNKKHRTIVLADVEPDTDYSADYLKAAREKTSKDKKAEKTVSLDGIIGPGDVYGVLIDTEEKLEEERLEKLKEEYAEKPVEKHFEGGGGDPLIARKEATDYSPVITSLPEKKKEPEEKVVTEVQAGGDALLPKPTAASEIGKKRFNSEKTSGTNAVKHERIGLFRRMFRRKR